MLGEHFMIDEDKVNEVINKGRKILVDKWISEKEFTDLFDNNEIKKCIDQCTSPDINDIFNAFSLFPIEETRVLILGQDPYSNKAKAHGFAFSVANGKRDASLLNIFKALCGYIACGKVKNWNTNLETWARDNKILLLNTALTYQNLYPDKKKKELSKEEKQKQNKCQEEHLNAWSHFIKQVINKLLTCNNTKLVIFLWGGPAQKTFLKCLNEDSNLFISSVLLEKNIFKENISDNKFKIDKNYKVIKSDEAIEVANKENQLRIFMTNHPSPLSENKKNKKGQKEGKFIEYSKSHFRACDDFLSKNGSKRVWKNLWEYINSQN